MTPHYRKHGKIITPISEEEFNKGILGGHFVKKSHKAFAVLLYYAAIRKSEALRSVRTQFTLENDRIVFEVGERLKKQRSWFKKTPPLVLYLSSPHMNLLYETIEKTRPAARVFPYCSKTGYNIISRVWKYPHLFRLSRITWLLDKWSISQVRTFTGLSLQALNYYAGIVDIQKIGKDLK